MGAGVGGSKKSEESSVGNGGEIGSCKTQDQRACRVPIRLALRAIKDGGEPSSPAPMAGAPGVPGQPAALPKDAQEQQDVFRNASAAWDNAMKQYQDKRDGAACVASIDQAIRLDPKNYSHANITQTRARCLMLAGRCDEGIKDLRGVLAAEDVKRIKSDADLDQAVRAAANADCPSATSKNDADFVTRAGREMNDLVKASDGKACRAKFDAIATRMSKLQKTPEDMQAKNMGLMALEQGSYCVAASQGCSAGLELYKKQYAMRLPNMSGVDKIATEAWGTLVQQKRVTCK
jgi:hypothetical protein